ncbi:WD40-repeat-containing domain protein [Gilbertella persicaria]|uniref:WD40-repeat-containing domain protein n=1 Tax=Gilbertella persicaria TaxID=101096 RepID=UPI00221F362C|nr:WD40-repeat-containing domain protein [Gilbertella persicaria]KAI8079031.1 WD40-repeat-containing domain protein [Gilbertella persicaria]
MSSPPSTPPISYLSLHAKIPMNYMDQVKTTFQQFNFQQRYFFLTEILNCCDSQLLHYVHTFITPKLKIDFLYKLPLEIALHIVSLIDDPYTLTQASCVSRHWANLFQDEGVWKSLCLKHNYFSWDKRVTYRALFRRQYSIDMAWIQGNAKVISCESKIGEGLATSVQMDDTFTVIGCDNNLVEVFDSTTGKHLRSLLGHEGGVWALQFIKTQQNQHLLVTGGCDRAARVWNLNTGELRHVLQGHVSTIRCLKIQNDRIAVTGSRDTTLRIWDIEQGQLVHICTGHQGSVRCIAIHGNRVASGSYDTTARLWDMDTGECIHEFIGHHSQIYAIAFDGTRVVTGSLDSRIRIWSAQTGECLMTLQGHTSLVGHLQLSNRTLVSGGADGCLRVWDIETFECKHRISAHDNAVSCLQFDQKRILSGGSDGRVKLWDIENGILIRSFTETARTVWKVQMNQTKAVVILQRDTDHHTMASHRTVIELHDFDLEE